MPVADNDPVIEDTTEPETRQTRSEPEKQVEIEPYPDLPPLGTLLRDIDKKPSKTLFSRAEIVQIVILVVAVLMLLASAVLWRKFGYGRVVWLAQFSMIVMYADGIWMAAAIMYQTYWKWQSQHISQIENEFLRERIVIDRLKHIQPDKIGGLRKRVNVEIDFSSKVQFITLVGLIVSVFLQIQPHSPSMAIITVNGITPQVSSVPTKWFTTGNAGLLTFVLCASFCEMALYRLNRKLRRVVYVLECAEDAYSSRLK